METCQVSQSGSESSEGSRLPSATQWLWDFPAAEVFLARLEDENRHIPYDAILDSIHSSKVLADSCDELAIICRIICLLPAGPLLDEFLALLPVLCSIARVLPINNTGSSLDRSELDFIVISVEGEAEICPISSTAKLHQPPLYNSSGLRNFIATVHEPWENLKSELQIGWASAVMELLLMELSNSGTKDHHRRICLKCLRHLAKQFGVLPPSLWMRDVVCTESYPVSFNGQFSDIYKGTHEGKPVCLKVMRHVRATGGTMTTSRRRKDFCHEAVVWTLLNHSNVLRFLGANTELFHPLLCLISPWMPNGNVMEYLRENPAHNRLSALLEIVEGLKYLHSMNPSVIHGDIKGANILVNGNGRCCLADFGLSFVYESKSLATASREAVIGTVPWSAPELLNPEVPGPNTTASDIYALGCTMYEVASGAIPFSHVKRAPVIMLYVINGQRPQRPTNNGSISDGLWNLIESCWTQSPSSRPSASQVGSELQSLVSNTQPRIGATRDMENESTDQPSSGLAPKIVKDDIKTAITDSASNIYAPAPDLKVSLPSPETLSDLIWYVCYLPSGIGHKKSTDHVGIFKIKEGESDNILSKTTSRV
ncbi:hypothetical protein VKT23_020100 [Stygiomarasmius scandens]|uniref:Protein kinase domain-containing protein n=1 Tax=Marasmiellus scandens TaxID=2682957 RepID=A0ABR1IMU3_9AGAR